MPTLIITNASQQAANDAFTALIDVGGAGTISIYDGIMPADPDDAITGNLLAVLTFSATAFNPTTTAGDAEANAITDDSNPPATGTANYARIRSGAGDTVFDCDVGEAVDEATMTLISKDIAAGVPIGLTAFILTLPSGA